MTTPAASFRLGFFTRLVDDVPAPEIYARALETFGLAEELGYEVGWVAQHHAHQEGGLPSPLVLLAAVAARNARIRLATGIITLPLEQPIRVAEDAAVLDAISGGRVELGFGSGSAPVAFTIFGKQHEKRHELYERGFEAIENALAGKPLVPDGPALFPPAPGLADRIWEATFRPEGGVRAGEHGHGLLLSRTQPRPPGNPYMPLPEIQTPIVDAYYASFRARSLFSAPRISLSRSVYVAPARAEALADAENGLRRHAKAIGRREGLSTEMTNEELLKRGDIHLGTPEEVAASLRRDPLLARATDLMIQVHPVDPSHEKTLRSLRLFATEVAPALGWRPSHQGGSA